MKTEVFPTHTVHWLFSICFCCYPWNAHFFRLFDSLKAIGDVCCRWRILYNIFCDASLRTIMFLFWIYRMCLNEFIELIRILTSTSGLNITIGYNTIQCLLHLKWQLHKTMRSFHLCTKYPEEFLFKDVFDNGWANKRVSF